MAVVCQDVVDTGDARHRGRPPHVPCGRSRLQRSMRGGQGGGPGPLALPDAGVLPLSRERPVHAPGLAVLPGAEGPRVPVPHPAGPGRRAEPARPAGQPAPAIAAASETRMPPSTRSQGGALPLVVSLASGCRGRGVPSSLSAQAANGMREASLFVTTRAQTTRWH